MNRRIEHICIEPLRLTIAAVVAAAAVSLLSGCGRPYTPKAPKSSLRVTSMPFTLDDGTDQGSFTCTATQTIQPEFDWELDGSGFYRACVSKSDSGDIILEGFTSKSDTLCAFPAQFNDQSHVYTVRDNSGLATVQCQYVTPGVKSRPEFKFTGIFNGVFVVEGPDKDKMAGCLAAGNYYLCPRYSFGKIK